MEEITFKPIGYVHVDADDETIKNTYEGVPGIIEINPEYREGLEGLEGFSHIIIIAYLHKTRPQHRKVLKVRPRRLRRFGIKIDDIPEVGVFASDSPHRPNPIALSIVELVEIKDNKIYVRGLDLFDGTPVLDIKPYSRDRCIENIRVPEWNLVLGERILEKLGEVKYI